MTWKNERPTNSKTRIRTQRDVAVGDVMTVCPHVLGPTDTMTTAFTLMKERDVRHIPIVEDGVVVGLVSERDLHRTLVLRNIDPQTTLLERVMHAPVHAVTPETPLCEVTRVMAEEKYDATVVTRGGRVVGILTTIDALRELTNRLENSEASSMTKSRLGS